MLTYLSDTALPFGLRLAPEKCELICFHREGAINKSTLPQIKLGDSVLLWKSSVVYLGRRFVEDNRTLAAVTHRIFCAESVVKRLNRRVLSRKGVRAGLKGRFIASAVQASLLYGLKFCAFFAIYIGLIDSIYVW